MKLVCSILNTKGLGYYGLDSPHKSKITQFLKDNGCDDADGMAALLAGILDQETLARDIKAHLKAPKDLPPKIAHKWDGMRGITCIEVYTGRGSEFITVEIDLQKPADTSNEHIVKIAMRFVGGGEQVPNTHDQTDEWLLKHGQTAKAWLKAYVAAYHNIFDDVVAQKNIVQLARGILDKSKLEELGISKGDIATIECGWHLNSCETPAQMAAWLCDNEAQQSELVRSMDEYNSYADAQAEAIIAKTLLAALEAGKPHNMNSEHEVPLAGGMDDAKEP